MKLGILGGTFDPIHLGHLRVAEEIREIMGLEKVYLIPGAIPPHKEPKPITPFNDRLAMTQMAAEGSPYLEVLDLEGRRQGTSYTIQTLEDLHRLSKPLTEFFFIIGLDAFLEITTWKNYKRLFDYTHFVVTNRPGFSSEEFESFIDSLDVGHTLLNKDNKTAFISPSGMHLLLKETTSIDISSTRIRKMASEGRTIRFLVPEVVRIYILEKELYSSNGSA